MGKISSSAAMASIASAPPVLAHGRVALGGGQHPGQQRDVPRSAESLHARRRECEVNAAIELVVARLGFVPRVGPASRGGIVPRHRVGHWATVRPGPSCHRLDHHDADVALCAHGKELLGRLAVLGTGPQRGIDREHHGVEVEPAERLEVGHRHLHVVPRDAGEAGVAGIAQGEDALERRRAPVELGERGHRMGLIEVEDVGVEQAAGRVELIADALRVGPQRLAADEELLAMGGQVRTHHRLGRPVLGCDVEVVHPVVEGLPEPLPRLLDAGGPAGGATQDGHAALVAGPSEAPPLYHEVATP